MSSAPPKAEIPKTEIPVVGGEPFAVRRIYCVGRNYRAHALEMGGDPDREQPFFFTKPADAVVLDGAAIPYPPMTRDFHHEVELVVAIGAEGHDVAVEAAEGLIAGYAVGLDMTRRDLQSAARKAGQPWDMAKGFDHSAPCGAITPRRRVGVLAARAIRLTVNDEPRQQSDLSQLIWSVPEIIAELSRYVTLKPGDLIYTGTPEGVGPVRPGDRLWAHIDGLADLRVTIAA
jgi:fumarylpyruvate hydrolase